MIRPSMWQRIFSWQSGSRPAEPEGKIAPRVHEDADAASSETFMAAFIASQKSGVAVQRELAKVMW